MSNIILAPKTSLGPATNDLSHLVINTGPKYLKLTRKQFIMVSGHFYMQYPSLPIATFHYKHQFRSNILETDPVAIYDGKLTLL